MRAHNDYKIHGKSKTNFPMRLQLDNAGCVLMSVKLLTDDLSPLSTATK